VSKDEGGRRRMRRRGPFGVFTRLLQSKEEEDLACSTSFRIVLSCFK